MADAPTESGIPNEQRWPSVHLAYDLARSSYDEALRRLDAVDGRIQALQAYTTTVTVAVPVIVASIEKNADYRSVWFVLALVAFAVAMVIGVVVRALGTVWLVDPRILYDRWLHYSEWEFKKNMIHWAGEHMRRNINLVNIKGWVANVMAALLLVESLFFVAWALAET